MVFMVMAVVLMDVMVVGALFFVHSISVGVVVSHDVDIDVSLVLIVVMCVSGLVVRLVVFITVVMMAVVVGWQVIVDFLLDETS